MRVLKRLFWSVTILFFLWLGGAVWFTGATLLMRAENVDEPTGAIVVLTGGSNYRIRAGLDLFAARRAPYLFISGVHHSTSLEHITGMWHGLTPLPPCCIVLDYVADTTMQNAQETRKWIAQTDIRSVRLVTSDYHMIRALSEIRHALPGVDIVAHPIHQPGLEPPNKLFWRLILSEYHKFLFRRIHMLVDLPEPLVQEAVIPLSADDEGT